jgi:histidyl-tRNA synthetase
MRQLGLGPQDVRVRLSDRRVLTAVLGALGFAEASHPAAYQFLDKLGRGNDAARRAALLAEGATDLQVDGLGQLNQVQTLDALRQAFPAAAPSIEPLQDVVAMLGEMGLGEFVDLDLTIVRGLEYYTGPVFELFDAQRSLRAICGGGRYDNLLQAVGGVDLPALGFGMGDVVLGELLRERGLAPTPPAPIDLYVAGAAPADRTDVLGLSHELRDAGWRVEYALGAQNLGRQFKTADARGARLVLIVGEAERARGVVQVKLLDGSAQSEVARHDVLPSIRRILGDARPPIPSPAHDTGSHG